MAQEAIILCTASLIQTKFNERKHEYVTALQLLQQQSIPFYIVENHLPSGPSFLDDYCSNVLYVASNNKNMRNKGVNEAISMIKALEQLNFNDQMMIIKVTGRYCFKNFNFIKLVTNNPSYDVFVKYDEHGQVYTGCYAIRAHQMKKMLHAMNAERMESEMISIEAAVADFIKNNIAVEKIYVVPELGITANFFGDGSQIISVEI